MTFYRAFFMAHGHIVHRHEFHAESDEIAIHAADKVADACSEACDGLEIWSGARPIASFKTQTSQPLLDKSRDVFARTTEALANAETIAMNAEKNSRRHKDVSARAMEAIDGIAIDIEHAIRADDLRFRESPRLQAKLTELSRQHFAAE